MTVQRAGGDDSAGEDDHLARLVVRETVALSAREPAHPWLPWSAPNCGVNREVPADIELDDQG